MNKKKSKICCIFHPQRDFGECSSDLSSDSDSSDSSGDEGDHDHQHCNHDRSRLHDHSSRKRDPSPNAYEKQPHYKNLSKAEPSS